MDRPRSPSLPRPSPGRSPSPLWDDSPSPRMHSPAPSRGRPRSYQDGRAPSDYSRSRSRSRFSSRSRSRLSSRSLSRTPREKQHDRHKGLLKTSAGLLAGIGVATFLAHKVWPKGILYGDVDDWASKKPAQRHHRPEPKQRRRPEPQRQTSEPHRPPRVIERVCERGNVTYREEIVPVRKGDARRRDLEARGFERVGRNSQPLPYPDRAYSDERFYGPSPRIRPGEPVFR